MLDDEFEINNNPDKQIDFIDEEDEFREEMKQVQEAYERQKAEGKKLQDEFEHNTRAGAVGWSTSNGRRAENEDNALN
jgi:hypothetical protein